MYNDSFKMEYKNVPVKVWFHNGGELVADIHSHADFEICMSTSGFKTDMVGNKKVVMKPGDMCFVNPFEVHSSIATEETHSNVCICFDCSLIADEKVAEAIRNEKIKIINFIDESCKHLKEIQRLFMNIVDCYKSNSEYMEMEIKAHITLLFSFLLKNEYVNLSYKETRNEVFYKKVFAYISQNYSRNITSKDVSNALLYNHSYFCRKFKSSFGSQFCDYLNMYRVIEAKKMLDNGEKTITQIALECGFNSQPYFSICFKRFMGILPSEYRRKVMQ